MSRVFWDTMLFIYLLEGNDSRTARVKELLTSSRMRGDLLFTSHLALGEVMAVVGRFGHGNEAEVVRETIVEMGFTYLAFDGGAVDIFSRLRGADKVKVADAIHLACAGSMGMDLFVTADRALTRLRVPGIHFIAGLETTLL